MTTNEIKTLIQNTIAGQGSHVDIGGKLAEILGAIVDAIPSGETPRPIVLTAAPVEGDTIETLAEKGLTLDEINAAIQGLRTGVVIGQTFYLITTAINRGVSEGVEDYDITFRFASQSYDDSAVIDGMTQYSLVLTDGTVSVEILDF